MTTDITELAKSLKAAAEKWQEAWGKYDKVEITIAEFIRAANQYESIVKDPANILALVEALEKAQRYIEELREWNAGLAQESFERQQLISELVPIRAAAEKLVRCKGRYHSEQNYRALAALFGVNTPDLPPLEHENVHYADAAEMEIAALRQRIAELESRTVKLPDLRQIVSGDRYVWSDGVYNYSQDVKVALAATGIKVEAE
ncbi:ead/Ea22-like family protein [Klebsiella pneumoniae]